jgi:hypothetical protein
MMQLSDDRVTTLVKQLNLYCSYITTCGEKIYQTHRDTNTVTKMYFTSNPIITFNTYYTGKPFQG